jgi:hypothetical protein
MTFAEVDWKRFHSDMEKYIPELGARQIVSCAGVEVDQGRRSKKTLRKERFFVTHHMLTVLLQAKGLTRLFPYVNRGFFDIEIRTRN